MKHYAFIVNATCYNNIFPLLYLVMPSIHEYLSNYMFPKNKKIYFIKHKLINGMLIFVKFDFLDFFYNEINNT